ncbi:hypothetical protein NLG97_g292 [Lecanicillium saksenae]|uniref:Uncharacterized protein n=1 Tax=Lecanicillium saksenae TaxID=468837 RepID=A0ACC1R9M9_9HYPO|nr:hypothetical protein NLG97_g292 [Lecanicillium saksenae]
MSAESFGQKNGHSQSMGIHSQRLTKKKPTKWSPEEDDTMIELRGKGMKWDDVAKSLPGRSSASCRLRHQNYLERRCELDNDRKDKLAILYHRFKAEMWAKVAEELQVPWRAVEAMHWKLGEFEMADRAGATPFRFATTSTGAADQRPSQTELQSRERVRSSTQANFPNPGYTDIALLSPSIVAPAETAIFAGRSKTSPSSATPDTQHRQSLPPVESTFALGSGLPPFRHQPPSLEVIEPLPGVDELTRGTRAYSTRRRGHLPQFPPPHLQRIQSDVGQQHSDQQKVVRIRTEPDHNRLKRPGSVDQQLQERYYRRRVG